MGIDYDGGMIVGADAEEVSGVICFEFEGESVFGTEDNYFEDFYEWYEDNGMSTYSLWYDCGLEGQVVGFTVNDVDPLADEFETWISSVKEKAVKFKELTGVEAKLIGMQNIW